MLWNGYTFTIPNDADVALINFAKNHSHPNIILDWLKLNTKRTVWNVIRHWQCETLSDNGKVSLSDVFINRMLIPIFLPRDGFFYFRDKIINEQRRRRLQNRTRDPSYT